MSTHPAYNNNVVVTDSKILANENAIDAIESKTDLLSVGFNGLKYDYGNFLTGAAPPNQLLIQHADLNNGSLSLSTYSMRVTEGGDLRLNVPTGGNFEFRINNSVQYNNTQIKNLVDNVLVSSSINLDHISPLSTYCYGQRVKTPTDSTNSIALSSSFQDLIYRNITTNGITYNESTGVFDVSATGIYKIEAQVSYTCGSGAERRMTLKLIQISNGNTIIRARDNASRLESSSNTDNTLLLNGMCRLDSTLTYKFQIQSSNTGSAVISNAAEDCNSLCIQGMVLNNSTTIPTNWGTA